MAKEPQTPLEDELARQEQEAEVTDQSAEERLVEGELEGLIIYFDCDINIALTKKYPTYLSILLDFYNKRFTCLAEF